MSMNTFVRSFLYGRVDCLLDFSFRYGVVFWYGVREMKPTTVFEEVLNA